VVYDRSVIHEVPHLAAGVRAVGVPFAQIGSELGRVIVKNIAALGAVQEATRIFPKETFLASVRQALRDKSALIAINEEAFARGAAAAAGATS
jgi:2-oxoisovalerate ferredoxin oxidoreductase beta subunit